MDSKTTVATHKVKEGIVCGDCIGLLEELPKESIDLVFADPPFNIGHDYDAYEDNLDESEYLRWSKEWIERVYAALKPTGTFWLAIGDEYAAELKVLSRQVGFHCRSWVVWYYTFGVNCKRKFTRSHAHLFHFVKDRDHFTFNEAQLDNRIPSARELVYNDKRANAKGRLPDDTWMIGPADSGGMLTDDNLATWLPESEPSGDGEPTFKLRPQDLPQSFDATENTWYFPRVAGTFKERAGFHGCQMPEQLLGRIIRLCSEPNDVVLDPFAGSATTITVAKKLGRRHLGFELSQNYVKYGLDRLKEIKVGDRLDGAAEPLKSVPKTGESRKKGGKKNKKSSTPGLDPRDVENRYAASQLALTLEGVLSSFLDTHDGYSADRLVADPSMNERFVQACQERELVGSARTWNSLLFRLRKAGKLEGVANTHRTEMSWEECDHFSFASEIALQRILNMGWAKSLDEILCDPHLCKKFDLIADRLAPGNEPFKVRWAALKLRKESKRARTRAAVLKVPSYWNERVPIRELNPDDCPEESGLYLVQHKSTRLYVGETMNLRSRMEIQFGCFQIEEWSRFGDAVSVQFMPVDYGTAGRLAWQSCLIQKFKKRPVLNFEELGRP